MAAKLTPARLAALRDIATGKVEDIWSPRRGYYYSNTTARASTVKWLLANGYVEATAGTAITRGNPLVLTTLGDGALRLND